MEEKEYKIELRKVLDENSTDTISKLNLALQLLPDKTQSIELMIFPGQDGEGTFGVRISLSGPDLYVLNKSINEHADIIDVRHTSSGLVPDVPLMDPYESNFEVNDVLADTVAEWLETIWLASKNESINLPVRIVADEGWGASLPKTLNSQKNF